LRALPIEPFRYDTFGERVVRLDGFVEIVGAYYYRVVLCSRAREADELLGSPRNLCSGSH
jgi:hypothetical protein